ncbi:hypothetical protein SAMN05216516_11515 [Izhakiella capsodis]|uniref:Uncharacterized protein n=1 Tax=Izhakiella capsodis TaxID=1367852 RepID=A0A1I5B847_9GAMM|nr:hypothetical protein SAMN05216516_11515 [Izhakiella capsodis]
MILSVTINDSRWNRLTGVMCKFTANFYYAL